MSKTTAAGARAPLTPAQWDVLNFADTYGPQIDFGGRTSTFSTRRAARECLANGWLSGEVRNCSITPAARPALAMTGGAK